MELKPPIPIAFSARRSPSTEQSVRPCPPQEILTPAYIAPNHDHNGSGLPRRQPFGSDLDAIMRNSFPDKPSAFPRSPTDADRKEYCSYWIRHGECDYMQQGCRYKHEMPDLMTLRSIGFRGVPEWHKEKMRMRNMRRPALPHLQSILNSIDDDSGSLSGRDESAATLAEAPRRLAVSLSPRSAGNIVQTVPAPSTIDLLSFDSDSDSESDTASPSSSPEAPENTPETSSYALLDPPIANRQGRFIPAGESLLRMSTPPLQPSPPSPSFFKKEEPKVLVERAVYTPPHRQAPIYKQYFKDIKATKSQEALLEDKKENVVKISPTDTTKDAQIAELQAKLAALAAATRETPKLRTAIMPAPTPKVKNPPAPSSSPAPDSSLNRAVGLMASKHANPHSPIQARGQAEEKGDKKTTRRSRSRARDVQKAVEAPGSGEKRGRRLPTARTRKVVSSKAVGGEKKDGSVVAGRR
ncbi:hypothetical protein BLS_001932 [Venturia inaequalis]|nr:hypothetical protein BLS_001932 [Venturia inaequalis]RDI89647.1 hypothetical protein Vi05172_g693 [Venturia inaequalis]